MVELQQHQAHWADDFRLESARVVVALGAHVDAVEHIGSTAVPGLLAKPIIDMAVRVAAAVDPFALGVPLATLGYHRHSGGPQNHAVYVRVEGDRRTHILHAFTAPQWDDCNQRVFRDKLLNDPDARRRYQALKNSLAGVADGRTYTALKSTLIQELLNEERAARGLPPTTAWDK
ncbi:GrpB family protein [Herbiconiux sp. CPCC 205763]|uniref:GrpB family protein n=1 Tax=Herbiconiux aconitum TaxID=2970913 RepID=A0ABT2GS80_9MICO|nr:GrpB family protein [Herbiconiux aconitum]MCS5717769.1 GrpB family protein [Herbiconiux aconitum]